MPRSNHGLTAQLCTLCSAGILATLLLTQLASAQQNPQPVQQSAETMKILAVVNGQQITRDQLSQEAIRRFGETVLESVVNNLLIDKECRKQGIRVTNQDIEMELDRRAKKFRMTIPEYIELISRERQIDEAKLRNEIIWTELALRRLASQQVHVAQEEIAQQMEAEFGAKVQVRAIALKDEAKARSVHAKATAHPQNFSRLAIDHSVDPNSASVGGLLPPMRRNIGEPALENAAFALQVGQVSQIIPLSDQFVILKCERHYPATELGPDQQLMAKQRIADQLRESKLGDAASQLFEQMQKTSQIVNVYNNEQLRDQMPGIAATIDGHQITMDQIYEECITRFGRDVLQSEIHRTVILQELQRQGMTVNDQDLQKEISRAAVANGIVLKDGTADVERWITYVTRKDAAKIEIYIQDEVWPTVAMKKLVAPKVQVTEEDMQMGFEANFGPRVQVLAIVLPDQRTAQKVWQMGKSNQTTEYFGQLAHQYSVEPASRANYGEVPPIQKHGGRKILEEEAFRLKPGEISGLIPVGENWVILLCTGRTTPVVQDFDAVRDELYADIMEKKLRISMAEEFTRLQQESQIDNFLTGSSKPGGQAVRQARQQPQSPGAPRK